jgi:uncharacterized membrane protein YdjX (TVP38/TMEM64 family)
VRRLVLLSVVLVALLAVAWILQPVSEGEVRRLVEPAGALAPVAYVAVAGALGALLIPGPLLAGASGLLFGTATGFVATLAASVASALIARWLGRRAGREAFEQTAGPRPLAAAEAVRRHGTLAVVAQRLAPVVPDGPFNYAFGVAGVAARPLVLGTLIGSAPRAFAYTALGDALDDPASPLALVAIGVVVLTGAVGTVLALRLRRRTS